MNCWNPCCHCTRLQANIKHIKLLLYGAFSTTRWVNPCYSHLQLFTLQWSGTTGFVETQRKKVSLGLTFTGVMEAVAGRANVGVSKQADLPVFSEWPVLRFSLPVLLGGCRLVINSEGGGVLRQTGGSDSGFRGKELTSLWSRSTTWGSVTAMLQLHTHRHKHILPPFLPVASLYIKVGFWRREWYGSRERIYLWIFKKMLFN